MKEVKGLECPYCAEFILRGELEPKDQPKKAVELETRYQCTECDEVYSDKEEAKGCCGA